jgi:hypothetical protein
MISIATMGMFRPRGASVTSGMGGVPPSQIENKADIYINIERVYLEPTKQEEPVTEIRILGGIKID